MSTCDLAVIGAGPYGLAAAAHLAAAGVEARTFGRPMEFWEGMPAGMLLRSAWDASHIADPARELTLDAYQAVRGEPLGRPLPLEDFVAYGRWFQERAVPGVDQRSVERVQPAGTGFRLYLEDGEVVLARRVVAATGLSSFAWRPPEFARLPAGLASHAGDHRGFAAFAGRRVLVVGGGQSALESAALLREAGAEVEVAVRAPRVHWLRGDGVRRALGPLVRLAFAREDVGPPGIDRLVAAPRLLGLLPRSVRDRVVRRALRPAGAAWLRPRLEGVPIHLGCTVARAAAAAGGLRVETSGGERVVDHLLLATGYRVDVGRYPFLSPELVRAVARVAGYPVLTDGFESSVPGLHFLGAPAAHSFGPLMRFVSGARYAARGLTRAVLAGAPVPAAEPEYQAAPAGAALPTA